MSQSSPLTHQDANHRDSAWERAANYEKEERPIHPVSKIVIKGAVDVVFFRSSSAHLVVAGENVEAIRNIKTRFEGDKLIIEQEGISISGYGGNIHVSGTGNIFVGGTINVGGRHGGVTMQSKGRSIGGIALPEAPSIRIKGSGDVTLYDLQQTVLDLGIQGSGDITAFGRVGLLDAEIAGSGDVDASELVATSAKLSVVGSGDIDAYVSDSVKARVAGSGDIVVRGNPPTRDHSVAGSGDIKFKKK